MKNLLIPAMLAVFAAASLGLALIFDGQGVLTVSETISVSAADLDITLEPNQTVEKTVSVTNSGTTPANVIVVAEVLNNEVGGPYFDVTVTPSQAVTVAGGQTANLTFTISASNGVQSGTGTVQLDVIRP